MPGVDQSDGAGGDVQREPTGGLPAGTAGSLPVDSTSRAGASSAGGARNKPNASSGGSAWASYDSVEEYLADSASRPAGIGPCGDTFVDYECDAILEGCPEGMHRDHDPADPCGICVDDAESPLTCEAVRTRYLQLLDHIIRSSCADFCESDADCFVYEVSNDCGTGCRYALFGGIDEEIEIVAEQFSAESCAPACVDVPIPACDPPAATTVACVQNRCVFQ